MSTHLSGRHSGTQETNWTELQKASKLNFRFHMIKKFRKYSKVWEEFYEAGNCGASAALRMRHAYRHHNSQRW